MITNVLAGSLTAFHLINVYGLPMRIRRGLRMAPDRRIKPFDCNYCLGGWLSLAFYLLPPVCSIICAVLFGGAYLSKLLK